MRIVDIIRRYGHPTGPGNVAPNFNGTTPTLLGVPTVGVPIGYLPASGVTGTPVPAITQQWTLDGSDISSATGATYTPVVGDATHLLRVREIASNSQGTANATSASGTVGAATGPSVPGNRVALGINVAQPLYYERAPGPVNWFMAVTNAGQGQYPNGGWELHSAANRNNTPTIASDGWPTEDFSAVTWSGEEGTGVITLHGQFKGQATVSFLSARGGSSLSAVSYNSGTNISTFTCSYDPTFGNVGPEFLFTSTKRTSTSGVGSGITDLYLWETRNVGNTTDRWDGARLTSTVFSAFTVLRVMDLMETNQASEHQDWANRKVFADFPGGRMASMCNVEAIVNLANVTSKDLWMQIPINASNDYIDHCFAYLDANLNVGRKVYFSVGNETWNPTFESFRQTNINAATELRAAFGGTTDRRFGRSITAAARLGANVTLQLDFDPEVQAQENIYVWALNSVPSGPYRVLSVDHVNQRVTFTGGSGGDGDLGFLGGGTYYFSLDVISTLRGPNSNVNLYEMGFWWMVRRCLQSSDRVRAVVGDSKMFTRFYPHVEEQGASGDGFQTLLFASYIAGGDAAVKTKIWALAYAPYFQSGGDEAVAAGLVDFAAQGASVSHTVQNFIDQLSAAEQFTKYFYHMAERVSHASHFGIKAITYEGGPDGAYDAGFQNNVNKNLAKLDAQFGPIHLDFLKTMGEVGTVLHMHYQESFWDAGNNPNVFTWGFTDKATNVTPYWQSFIDYNAIASGSLPSINPVSGTISTPTVIDGSLCVGRYGVSASYPGLHTPNVFPNNNKQDWLITAPGAGTYNLVIAYACNFVPNDMSIEVNGVAISGSTFTPTVTDTFPALAGTHNSPTFSISLLTGVNAVRVVGLVNHNNNNNEAFKSLTFTRTA